MLAGPQYRAPTQHVERFLRLFRAGEHVSRTAKHRRPRRSHRQCRIEPSRQNVGLRVQSLLVSVVGHIGLLESAARRVPLPFESFSRDKSLWGHMANKGKIALITGANKGLGFEMARQLGKEGVTVVLGARDPQ